MLNPLFLAILSIPTILISLTVGFLPWGLVTAIATAIGVTLFAGLFPKKNYIRMHVKTALEGLSYNRLDDAKHHISIAIREAGDAAHMDASEAHNLCAACEKVAASLYVAGHGEFAKSLLDESSKIASRFLPPTVR